jgi:hypothetical protein
MMRVLGLIIFWFFGSILHLWSVGAISHCSFPSNSLLSRAAVVVYLLAVVGIVAFSKQHSRAFLISLLFFLIVAFWFISISPKTNAVYPPEVTMPYAEINGNAITVHNVRNCEYRTREDFDVHYETRTYDLQDLETCDVYLNYWGMDLVAHVFLSFGFADGRYLAVSVESRREVGEPYDELRGFFKQYELIYVWGDERDLVRTRTNYRGENVYLYRSTFQPEQVRKLFMSMITTTNELYQKPRFYNSLAHNCTNTLAEHIIKTGIYKIPIWKRRILTGSVDRRLYEEGLLPTDRPFADLRREANIDARAKAADKSRRFSQKIRTHL